MDNFQEEDERLHGANAPPFVKDQERAKREENGYKKTIVELSKECQKGLARERMWQATAERFKEISDSMIPSKAFFSGLGDLLETNADLLSSDFINQETIAHLHRQLDTTELARQRAQAKLVDTTLEFEKNRDERLALAERVSRQHDKILELNAEAAQRSVKLDKLSTEVYCSACGERFPIKTDAQKDLMAHIRVCPQHPMRALEEDLLKMGDRLTRSKNLVKSQQVIIASLKVDKARLETELSGARRKARSKKDFKRNLAV